MLNRLPFSEAKSNEMELYLFSFENPHEQICLCCLGKNWRISFEATRGDDDQGLLYV